MKVIQRRPRHRLRSGAIVLLLLLAGCENVGFYAQAVSGQLSLLSQRRPISEVEQDPATSAEVRHKLALAEDVVAFASQLGLPVDSSYRDYADIGRPYVVWNVFAAPEFSTKLRTFCYPIAGCVVYRGYFNEASARRFADSLAAEGYDTFVGGVAAYSTLGWFDDPILNTFINRTDERFAALLFHEIAHKAVYVQGDTQFNESLATTIELAALGDWLQSQGQAEQYEAYVAQRKQQDAVIALMNEARTVLTELYRQPLPAADMREAKRQTIDALRAQYEAHKLSGGSSGFDDWIRGDINNARLGSVSVYNDWVLSFDNLRRQYNDLPAFIAAVKALAKLDKAVRDERLAALRDT